MKNLIQTLQKHYVPPDLLGGEQIDESYLVKDLNKLREELNKRSWLITVMIICLYILSLGITLFYLRRPEHIVSLFSATGMSNVWAVLQMNKLWKEVARINLIIVLCRSLNQSDVNSVIGKLIDSGFNTSQK
jgi:hypothetical protein